LAIKDVGATKGSSFISPRSGLPAVATRDLTMSSNETPSSDNILITDRRSGDRRVGERRKKSIPVAVERRSGQERRQQPERRRQIDPTTCERDYSDEEILFMKAMDQYKRDNRRPFPTWSEVLEVLRALGYRKVAEPTEMPGLPTSVPVLNDKG
jgi:hypothetical protein